MPGNQRYRHRRLEALTRAGRPPSPARVRPSATEAPGLSSARQVREERATDRCGQAQHELPSLPASPACGEAVRAIVSDDHNAEQGLAATQRILESVLAESGPAELINVAVQLSSQLGSALERIATEQGLAATDLAEVWFLE